MADFSDTEEYFSDAEVDSKTKDSSYTVLTESDVRQRQDNDITTICSTLPLSRVEARILLTNFKWNVEDLTDAWFNDEEQVRNDSGLVSKSSLTMSSKVVNENIFTCLICFSDYSRCNMRSAGCDHMFCKDCYTSYIESKIDDGHVCVTLKCPQPDCVAAVGDDLIQTLVSDECLGRFNFYVVRSYLEEKKNVKWCPAPGCDCAIEFELGSDHYNVKCDCSHTFCWNCCEEIHRPVDCKTVEAWSAMNNDVATNSLWILAYTKPCPKCNKAIEKNKGCMHMSCPPPCKHQFCWVCLGDWKSHSNSYSCHVYVESKTDREATKQEAARHLRRCRHYYERWAQNQSSKDKAIENLNNWKTQNIGEAGDEKRYGINTEEELEFVTEAWLQIIECRRVLKWTYPYAFYMDEEEKSKKQLLEYLQGEAEASLERLHHCVENDLQDYLNAGGKDLDIKLKVMGLTKVTNTFFENLVRALENGLEEADDKSDCRKRIKKSHGADGGESSSARDGDGDDYEYDDGEYMEGWDCPHCTFHNLNDAAQDCEICALPRAQ